MEYYYAVVHVDEDSAFGVTFPDLPGCFSAADEMADIIPNACEALALYFEDMDEVIAPSKMEEIKHMVADDLADGAFLVAVPYLSTSGKLARVNISMDRGMIDAIDRAASSRKMTRSGFLAVAARNEIENRH